MPTTYGQDVITGSTNAGADDLSGIMGRLGGSIQTLSNNWAALMAQHDDIAAGRWTLNNAVYQFNVLSPLGQAAVIAGVLYLGAALLRKV